MMPSVVGGWGEGGGGGRGVETVGGLVETAGGGQVETCWRA